MGSDPFYGMGKKSAPENHPDRPGSRRPSSLVGYAAYHADQGKFLAEEGEPIYLAHSRGSLWDYMEAQEIPVEEYRLVPFRLASLGVDQDRRGERKYLLDPQAWATFERLAAEKTLPFHRQETKGDLVSVEIPSAPEWKRLLDPPRGSHRHQDRQGRAYQVRVMACDNPDCDCTEIVLSFMPLEEEAPSLARGREFRVRVDPETWTLLPPGEGDKEDREFVEEYLRTLDPEIIKELGCGQEWSRDDKQILRDFVFSPREMLEGGVVPHDDVDGFCPSVASGGWGFHHKLDLSEERTCYVIDAYCANPKCDCRQAHLVFTQVWQKPEKIVISTLFTAICTLKGKMSLDGKMAISSGEAWDLLSRWQMKYPDGLEDIRRNYREMRAISKRSAREIKARFPDIFGRLEPVKGAWPVDPKAGGYDPPLFPSRGPASEGIPAIPGTRGEGGGPNSPCPCGSGKKRKKCCG